MESKRPKGQQEYSQEDLNRFFSGEKRHKLSFSQKALRGIAITAVAGIALTTGVFEGFLLGIPVKQRLELEATKSEIVDINLQLSETSHTAYTQKIQSKAEYSAGIKNLDLYRKSDQTDFLAETKMTMKGNTAKAQLNQSTDKITVHIDPSAIEANINVVAGSIEHHTDGNLAAALLDDISTTIKAVPGVGDWGVLEGVTTISDKSTSALGNVAMVEGLHSAANTCVPKAWPILYEPFADGVANDVLLGAKLYDPELTREDVTVLIGDAQTEAENEQQIVGKVTSVDETYNKMVDALKDKNIELGSKPGTCELSDEMKAKYANDGAQPSATPATETSNE